jgi:hypothetical protein
MSLKAGVDKPWNKNQPLWLVFLYLNGDNALLTFYG